MSSGRGMPKLGMRPCKARPLFRPILDSSDNRLCSLLNSIAKRTWERSGRIKILAVRQARYFKDNNKPRSCNPRSKLRNLPRPLPKWFPCRLIQKPDSAAEAASEHDHHPCRSARSEVRASAGRLQELQQQVASLINQLQGLQGGNQQPQNGGGGGVYIMAGQVIAAGASATGVTVDWVIGGTGIVANANATVWNMMQSATVSGKTIMLGANPDGSFTVISQSC